MDGVDVIEAVARRRGYRLRGDDLDLEKAAMTLLTDYRSGVLGRISLETPETRSAMLREQALAKAADHEAAEQQAEP
jgi:ribosome biogenesis GTPase A